MAKKTTKTKKNGKAKNGKTPSRRRGPFPIAGPKLKVNQVWQDIPAGEGAQIIVRPRQIQVYAIDKKEGYAYCTVYKPALHKQYGTKKRKKVGQVGRHVAIRIDRFRPVAGGYDLVGKA